MKGEGRVIRLEAATVVAVVLTALASSIETANGSAPAFGCEILALSPRFIGTAGVHVSTAVVASCRVAIEAIRLTFPQPEHGEPYRVSEPNGVPSSLVQPGGPPSRVLTLRLPHAILAKKGGACPPVGVAENVAPLLPVGSRVTVTLISTQGVSETSAVSVTAKLPHFCMPFDQ